jgi:hypothetical protein
MGGQRLCVGAQRRFHREGDLPVQARLRRIVEVGQHGFPDTIVVRLESTFGARARRSHEIRQSQLGDPPAEIRGVHLTDGAGRDVLGDGRARHAHDLDQLARTRLEPLHARPEGFVEVQVGPALDVSRVAHQFVDEQRMTVGLARDRGGAEAFARTCRAARGNELRRELVRLFRREAPHFETLGVAGYRDGQRVPSLAPCRANQKEGRGLRRAQDLDEQRNTVGIGPLVVVDDENQRPRRRDAPQQLAERCERPRPGLLEIEPKTRWRHGLREAVHASQDREHLGQETGHSREEVLRSILVEPRQEVAERVDDAVDRFVGHRLPLITSPGEHDGIQREALDEASNERALADAGLAVNAHDGRVARLAVLESCVQGRELIAPAYERIRLPRGTSEPTEGRAPS